MRITLLKEDDLGSWGTYELASNVVGSGITLAGINLRKAAFLVIITIGPSIMHAGYISTKMP